MRKITLLFTVLLSLVGVTSKAETLTETFDDVTVSSRYLLSNGWVMVHSNGNYQGFGGSYDYQIKAGNYDGETGNALFCDYSDNNEYVIIPTKLCGTFTYYVKRSSSSNGTVTFFEASKDGDNFTVTNHQLATTSTSSSWVSKSFDLGDEGKYVAIRLLKSRIDQISATIYKELSGPALVVKDGSTTLTSGYSYSFGLATAGKPKSFTLSNPGTAELGVSVSETGNFGATLSASSIAAGGEVTLTVTMPATTGSSEVTITPDAADVDPFVINVSGSIRDESKLWCNFSEGVPEGWTNSGNWTIATSGAGEGTSNGGYARNTSYGSDKLMYTPLIKIAEGEKIYLMVNGYGSTASWNTLTIQYSADGSTWKNAKVITPITYNTWTNVEVSEIPAGNWYIGFYGSYVSFTDIYGGTESTSPVLSLSQSSYDFGLIANETTTPEAITITNTGKTALTGMSIISNNANFTVAVTDDATTIAENGGTATFNVTMAPNDTGAQSATITIKSDNADDLVFTVTGAVAKEGITVVDFNANTLPANWKNSSSPAWSFSDGKAVAPSSSYGSYATLTTPKLSLAADDILAIKIKANYSSYGHLKVYTSTDGTTFNNTAIKEVSYTELSTEEYKTIIVTGLTTGIKAIRFEGYQVTIDEIAGLTYAPVLSVTNEAGEVVTSPVNYAFGDIVSDKTVTFNFTNAGAGTINITNVVSSNAVFTTNWIETVAASNYDLVITANYDADRYGEQNGIVTVTTTEGEFVINLTGLMLAADLPILGIYVDDVLQGDNAIMDFGIITEATTKEFVIKNDGTGTLKIKSIELPEGYSIDITAPSEEAPLALTVGQSQTVKLTLAAETKAMRNDQVDIFVVDQDDYILGTSAIVIPEAEVTTFNTLPTNWNNGGWTISNGEAYANNYSTKPYLTTSKLKYESEDFIIVTAKCFDNDSGSDYINVEYSKDNGESWTQLVQLKNELPANSAEYADIVVSGIPEGTNRLRFQGYYARIKQIAGLTLDPNDPRLSVYSDADCKNEIDGTYKVSFLDFIEQAGTGSVTREIYIKNTGTGTLTITGSAKDKEIEAAPTKTSLAAGESTSVKIRMYRQNVGLHEREVTIETNAGNITLFASGLVRNASKYYLDFSATDAKIPAAWSNDGWKVENKTAVASGDLQTKKFIAAAGEQMFIEAISTSNNPALSYSYSTDNGQTWSEAVSVVSQLNRDNYSIITMNAVDTENESNVLVKFTGSNVNVRRIYGFTMPIVPIMITDAADYNFGMQTEAKEQVFNVSNEGNADLTNLTAVLTAGEESDYTVSVGKTTLAAGESTTITVTQKFSADNLGVHADVLTISADGQEPVVINLSGSTRDGSKLYVDFDNPNAMPEGWKAGTSWNVYTYTTDNYAYQSNYSTASTLQTTTLAVEENEKLTFQAARYRASDAAVLKVRYTVDGSVTWSDYIDFSDQITDGNFKTLELSGVPAGTAVIEFYGKYVKLDNISGFAPTDAPMIALTEGSEAAADKAFGNLTAAGSASYTLTNNGTANLVSTLIATTVTAAISTEETEGVTIDGNKVTLEAGKKATITVTMPFVAPFGDKTGSLKVTSEGWVGDLEIAYTATLIDPTALYIDFADNKKPAGWYNAGWTFSNGYAEAPYTSSEMITELFEADAEKNTLSFEAKSTTTWGTSELTVYTSTDRQNWSEGKTFDLTSNFKPFSLDALEAGTYYVKFVGKYAAVDNIAGLKKTEAPEHDLFFVSVDTPDGSYIPGSLYTATVKVVNLRAESETVAAELYIKNEKVTELTEQVIALDETKTFELSGNVPEEGKHIVYVKVYNDDVTIQTEVVTIESAHNLTLEVTDFARKTAEGEEEVLTADENNQFTATFDVTVKNTGSTELTPTVKVMNGEAVVGTATAVAAIPVGEAATVTVTCENISAGEGGELSFTAAAYLGENEFTFATPVIINVNASAPKFVLYQDGTPVNDGDDVMFGVVKEAKTYSFVIKNEGTKAMQLVSIVAPEGFEATAVTDENKTIAANGTLDINVTLKAAQDKVAGALVITYKVDETANGTFTLQLSGRSIGADVWTEDFAAGTLPIGWVANGWTIGTFDSYGNTTSMALAPSSSTAGTLITPYLTAKKGDVLTWDAYLNWSDDALVVEYSTDGHFWTQIYNYKAQDDGVSARYSHKEMSFTAPANGSYYLRFTSTYQNGVDNFAGFQLNLPDHILAITASHIPTSGIKVGVPFNATVTVKEIRGVDEENVVAKLYMDEILIGTSEPATVAAGETKQITLTCTPIALEDEAFPRNAEMHIEIEYAGFWLSTDQEFRNVAEFVKLELAENAEKEITTGYSAVYDQVTLTRSFVKGWNTFVAPVAVNMSEFGEDAQAYTFQEYADGTLKFSRVSASSLSAATPYIIYVPEEITEKVFTWNSPVIYSSYVGADNIKVTKNSVTFQGTYAPMAAGTMTGKWGVTKDAKIAKGSEKASMKGFRAYFELPEGASVKALSFDDGATGIRTISVEELDGQIFDINGRKVNKAQRGVYVVNGKKVSVK